MNQAEKYLNELMYHISTSHLDMGGNHRYVLRASSYPLISEIKMWQSTQQAVEDGQAKCCDFPDITWNPGADWEEITQPGVEADASCQCSFRKNTEYQTDSICLVCNKIIRTA